MINRRNILAGIGLAGALASCSRQSSPQKAARIFEPRLPGREVLRRRSFPNLGLITHLGRQVKFYDDLLRDKIVVLNFMYADCKGICPTILDNLKRVRKILDEAVKKDIFIYSLTIQPEVDTPAKLKDYAEMHHIEDPRWSFLTGRPEEMDTLRHLLGFADPNPEVDKDKSKHSGMLRYGNEPQSIWGSCQGSAEPEWIAQEIQFAVPREFKRHPRINE
jgi:protein SCO1